MAVCTTGAEWASESAYVPKPLFQIVQAILRRSLSFVSPLAVKIIERTTSQRRWGQVIETLMLKKVTHFICSGPCAAAVRRTAQDAVFQKAFAGLG
jgi:hypothetical protein